MKIILLPGLDGTGLLFGPLVPLLDGFAEVITFPSTQPQTYEAIYSHIKAQLPAEDFCIVAESFSGPIAARLASDNLAHLKGIIFVATFLSCPSKSLVKLARRLPLKTLLKLPFSTYFIRKIFIGPDFPISLFHLAMSKVSDRDLKQRLASLEPLAFSCDRIYSPINTLYLRAKNELFIGQKHVDELIKAFPDISVIDVHGPHFLLQASPEACAKIIASFVDRQYLSR